VSSVVGREPELTVVEAFLAAGEGRGALAILGEPGIGKTTVWEEAVSLARSRGATVLVARPAESEAKLSFAGLADLLSTVPEELFSELPAPQRAGLDAALLRTASTRSPERRLVGTGFLTSFLVGWGGSLIGAPPLDESIVGFGNVGADFVALRPLGIAQLGILVLIATPVVRVAVSLLEFLHERDGIYAAVTLAVLGILLVSLLLLR